MENINWDVDIIGDDAVAFELYGDEESSRHDTSSPPNQRMPQLPRAKTPEEIHFEKLVHDALWIQNPLAPNPEKKIRNDAGTCLWSLVIKGVAIEQAKQICDPSSGPSKPPKPAVPSAEAVVKRISERIVEYVVPGEVTWQPAGSAYVNKDVYFAATTKAFTKHVTVAGVGVEMRGEPVSFRWKLGDGREYTTTTPGGPWPHGTAHWAYSQPGTYRPALEVDWRIDVGVAGEWRTLQATTHTQGNQLRVVEAEAVLTRPGD
ncbi:hypothetical protein J2S49_000295 [Arcanobacterium wilhelmae]|uniref:PKD domain-containing protein n=2 Tax=Arcanobacterium wilhelmae TaxID=1803177 RepID=A0ABT9N936_9ACTO|nr:hypothetical protein [Arcanobacterium wilhelmae]MDP9800219.1 hypothetical protein [Arcanobacterium wilhelmae]WFN89658.1 hypothetical protein P8A24_05475 [Arcanobacterium wilhelmae]